jgi:hypothetical protein
MIESQELQENVFCASGVVECVNSSFLCLIINCNPEVKVLSTLPKTRDLPKISGRFGEVSRKENALRDHALQSQLRLAHVKEGEQEIRKICADYSDVFKLPGDKLTATSAIEHYTDPIDTCQQSHYVT